VHLQPQRDDTARCYSSRLTDEMWLVIQPLLPVRDLRKGGRPRVYGDRLVLDTIFYVLRAGCQWRMVPRAGPARRGQRPPALDGGPGRPVDQEQ